MKVNVMTASSASPVYTSKQCPICKRLQALLVCMCQSVHLSITRASCAHYTLRCSTSIKTEAETVIYHMDTSRTRECHCRLARGKQRT